MKENILEGFDLEKVDKLLSITFVNGQVVLGAIIENRDDDIAYPCYFKYYDGDKSRNLKAGICMTRFLGNPSVMHINPDNVMFTFEIVDKEVIANYISTFSNKCEIIKSVPIKLVK